MTMRIGLDIDDVTFNLVEVWLKMYNEEYGDNKTLTDIHSWEFSGTKFKCSVDDFRRYLDNSYLQLTARPFLGVKNALQAWVGQGHLPVFITATRRSVAGAKLDKLLMELGPDTPFEVHFTKEKQFVQCDMYVDDNPADVERYLTTLPHGRVVVIFDRPWNQHVAAVETKRWLSTMRRALKRDPLFVRLDLFRHTQEPIRARSWADLQRLVEVYGQVLSACGKT